MVLFGNEYCQFVGKTSHKYQRLSWYVTDIALGAGIIFTQLVGELVNLLNISYQYSPL